MKESITRRAVIKGGLMASVMVPALVLIHAPAATLGFVNDASKVNATANSTYAPGQKCANCQQYQGKAGEARGGCVLFPGKSVPAAGWCKVWRKMP
jgi:hypothetical protein